MLEGEAITPVQCTADCNPQCTYTWTGPDATVTTENGLLEIQEIHRIQNGEHRCEAGNSVSSQTQSLTVTVRYPPDVSISVRPNSIVEGGTLTLICTADSNPSRNDFTWKNVTENSEVMGGNQYSSDTNSTLTIQNARCQKQSQIQCKADNGVEGSPRTKVSELDVKCKYLFLFIDIICFNSLLYLHSFVKRVVYRTNSYTRLRLS